MRVMAQRRTVLGAVIGATPFLQQRKTPGARNRLPIRAQWQGFLQQSSRQLSRSLQCESRVAAGCTDVGAPPLDPHLWLEDVQGNEALAWVRSRNQHAVETFGDPRNTETYCRVLAALNSKDKIPYINRLGEHYYNFWRDADHPQGIWRRTTLESFRGAVPEWELVLDLDALSSSEGISWVWHGSTVLNEGPSSTWDRVLLHLSPGGSDAEVVREFDVDTKKFIPEADGGFIIPESKARVSYRSRNELLVGTDFGEGSMTASGYPRTVKSWKRGTPLSSAVLVYEGKHEDVSISGSMFFDRGHWHEFRHRGLTFFTSQKFYRRGNPSLCAQPEDEFARLALPEDATTSTFADACLIKLKSHWKPDGITEYKGGSLLSIRFEDLLSQRFSGIQILFEPTSRTSLPREFPAKTRNYLVVTVLDNVRKTLQFWEYVGAGKFEKRNSEASCLSVGCDVGVSAVWAPENDQIWITGDGYLQPDTLQLADARNCAASPESLKAKPAVFNSSGLIVEQRIATSSDGTEVPYFLVKKGDAPLDGSNPVILDGYGGFQISRFPVYSTAYGIGWLEKGGCYAVANIRGGGEFGPMWHKAAKREKRHKAYEDFEAVARDLIRSGLTSPERLACVGGSNGGMLVGNMLTREGARLFGAIVCRVPLLDMWRYNKLLAGASWVAEYGNPDEPKDWAFLRDFSPYHKIEDRLHDGSGWGGCPPILFTTSTKDDRVHPAHARKMVCKLLGFPETASKVYYWENIEGGHGGAANNEQTAYMWTLIFGFLHTVLTKKDV